MYLVFINSDMRNEAKATLAGRVSYNSTLRDDRVANLYLLRRNIHRLEKGLIMRPRRSVFATDYLRETVETYSKVRFNFPNSASEELAWAHDVLSEYFSVVELTDVEIGRCYEKFKSTKGPALENRNSDRLVPFARGSNSQAFDLGEFERLCRHRRSVRWFLKKSIPQTMIDRAIEIAGQAPTACNRQPYQFKVFNDPISAAEIAAIPMGTKGFADQVPGIVVLIGQLRAYPFARDRHAIYIDSSLAAMSFILSMEAQGLSTCSINWPDHEPYETVMRERLNLATDERVIMLIAYGWADPDRHVPRSTKRSINDIRDYQ